MHRWQAVAARTRSQHPERPPSRPSTGGYWSSHELGRHTPDKHDRHHRARWIIARTRRLVKIRGSGASERTGGGLGGLARRRRPHLFLGRGTGLGSELVLSFCTKKMEPQCMLFSAVGCRRFGANIFQRPSPPVGTTRFHAQHWDWLVGLETQAPASCQPSSKTHLPAKHDTENIAKAGQSVHAASALHIRKRTPAFTTTAFCSQDGRC